MRESMARRPVEHSFPLRAGRVELLCKKTTETKTAPRTSSFWNGKRSKLTAIAGLNPCLSGEHPCIATAVD